jgi:hypothetical protein
MDVSDPQHLFDNDKHLEDDQGCSFPDYEPGTTASEFDGALDKDDESEEGGDEASEPEPEIRTRRSSTNKVGLRFNFNLIILSRVSFVDWALEARCCTYLRGMIMLKSVSITQCIYHLKVPKWKSKSHAQAATKVMFFPQYPSQRTFTLTQTLCST